MTMLVGLVETAVTLAASGYAVTKVFTEKRNVGIVPPPRGVTKHLPLPAPVDDTLAVERREAQLFIDVPSAFWLDPNRYGDDPDWRERLFGKQKSLRVEEPEEDWGQCLDCGFNLERFSWHGDWFKSCTNHKCKFYDKAWGLNGRWLATDSHAKWYEVKKAPICPVCPDGGKRTVLDIAKDGTILYDCFVCGAEFTTEGETSKSKKQRHAKNGNYTILPCKHTGEITRMRAPYTGYHVSRCNTCQAEWEPRSDDFTGRSLAQGESISYRSADDNEIVDMPKPPVMPDEEWDASIGQPIKSNRPRRTKR